LGRTGVGKSSLGNQLFGDKMTFAVGHKSTSKTETISWAADHFLGTGQCITIIDTPGTKDTEGKIQCRGRKLKIVNTPVLYHIVRN
jgi:predicted GTPase